MALNDVDKNTLEEIVAANGNCMDSKRCTRCPFRSECLPEFLNPITPTPEQRLKVAQDVLTYHYLIDEDAEAAEHRWDKK